MYNGKWTRESKRIPRKMIVEIENGIPGLDRPAYTDIVVDWEKGNLGCKINFNETDPYKLASAVNRYREE